ncbi:AbrB/MazE/SpoVT family DNA-binding domain-containing protein [Skermania sp. ID1734]|uniref:AbrB/MazE/SpoVT family DNA-binding domain-containing protein n=1 Tax=Skermania sp. ID1734 TaxID=2597516 RepID=UPI00117F7885|nr:AbrB/MazE/SpoVT family DNA-binding domain-containing protein [Skermania sp. ID1734]TSD99428.1 AbrB/MazE/SpoVT family DNA-binding domain-containing protein [Skermania sp. ID1734]
MRTTIDSAGRIVVPKAVREAMGLEAGRAIDVVYVDGRIEIELAPAEVAVAIEGGLPLVTPTDDLPQLTDDQVRDTLDSTRR